MTSSADPVNEMEIEPEDEVDDDIDLDKMEECSVTEHSVPATSIKIEKKELARAERAAKAATANAKRYDLVRQGNYVGIYNKDSGTQELFHTEAEALAYLDELLHGREAFRFYHGSPPS